MPLRLAARLQGDDAAGRAHAIAESVRAALARVHAPAVAAALGAGVRETRAMLARQSWPGGPIAPELEAILAELAAVAERYRVTLAAQEATRQPRACPGCGFEWPDPERLPTRCPSCRTRKVKRARSGRPRDLAEADMESRVLDILQRHGIVAAKHAGSCASVVLDKIRGGSRNEAAGSDAVKRGRLRLADIRKLN